ncbi:MAG: class I SAM-dependent methyltransferase [Planctomycetes bacterium]|jgi:SAM-dependent methyltransferase|nr:class I SAM-dependent methyltransferase [Planctomycetota bacterium]
MSSEPSAHLPSAAIVRWSAAIPAGGRVLDVAAGGGRHARWFAQRGHPVLAVDRDVTGLADFNPGITVLAADLEGAPWPFAGQTFAAVVVVNYLWRPLLPLLVDCVAPGGALLYETFAVGHERHGRPRNPDFLLRPGELLDAVRGRLEVRDYQHGPEGEPVVAVRQRLLAVRPGQWSSLST